MFFNRKISFDEGRELVVYTGGSGSYNYSRPASELRLDKVYEVERKVVNPFQTNLILHGMKDREYGYNSVWFTPVIPVLCYQKPEEGKTIRNFLRRNDKGVWEECLHSSRIIAVKNTICLTANSRWATS